MTSQQKPPPIPDTYRRVTPSLVVRDAAKALEFYRDVFGATERMRFPGPDGPIAHSEIQIGDAVVMVEDESPTMKTQAPPPEGLDGTPCSLYLYVEDVDAVIARALDRGATLLRSAQDQFYGDRDGSVIDPFGHCWVVATHVEDVAPEEMGRRLEAMMAQGGAS